MELPQTTSALINMLSVSNTDGPAFNTKSQTQQHLTPDTSTAQPSITPDVSPVSNPTPKSPDSRQVRDSSSNAENQPLLQADL